MFNWLKKLLFVDREFGAVRSPDWNSVRQKHLETESVCVICGTQGTLLNRLEVHHVIPFHIRPDLELSQGNLITLCRQHHLLAGHLMSWKSYNENIEKDSLIWREKIKSRP